MKKLMAVVVTCLVLCTAMGAEPVAKNNNGAFGAGPAGEHDKGVLEELGFELVVPANLEPGAPAQLKITKKNLEKLAELMKAGKGVAVSDSGELEIVPIGK